MATPTGSRADAARGFFSRVRRRKKQDQKDYGIAGLVATPHDFGAAASSAAFPNALTLPANIRIQVEVLAASGAIPAGDTLFDDGVVQARNAEDMASLTTIRKFFGEGRDLTITRGAAVSTGTLQVYFFGPKSERILIGTGSLT
jgi:hypothetical protein